MKPNTKQTSARPALTAILMAVCLTGCATHRRIKYPPMPPTPPLVANSGPLATPPEFLIVEWDFRLGDKESLYRDTLEFTSQIDRPWSDVAGPYALDPEAVKYRVLVPGRLPSSFFRVRRERGTPNVN